MKKVKTTDYKVTSKDVFFLDTNIWLYLYASIGKVNQNIVDEYSDLLSDILDENAKLVTTSMQISEFINAYFRIEYNAELERLGKKSNVFQYKRDFRSSKTFQTLVSVIHKVISNKILKYTIKLDDDFSTLNIEEVLPANKEFDFNDEYFLYLCEKNKIKIVSHDKDIAKSNRDIELITSHR